MSEQGLLTFQTLFLLYVEEYRRWLVEHLLGFKYYNQHGWTIFMPFTIIW